MASATPQSLHFTLSDPELKELFEGTQELQDLRDLLGLVEWDQQVYTWGLVYTPGELVRKVTGEELNPEYFVRYATEKSGSLYSLNA